MTDTFRAMCAELLAAWQKGDDIFGPMNRARALLAQPVADGPRPIPQGELDAIAERHGFDSNLNRERAIGCMYEALRRWGRPTPQPVAVSERLPGPEDCDEQGRCWWLKQRANPDHDLLMPTWHLQRQGPVGTTFFRFTHWAPANALPTPETNV